MRLYRVLFHVRQFKLLKNTQTSLRYFKIQLGRVMQYGALPHVRRVKLLYKTILQLHRQLPSSLQSLGDSYVKEEFKRHKKCSPVEAAQFMMEWTHYAVSLANQLGLQEAKPSNQFDVGRNLDMKTVEQMRDDQLVQLHQLLGATKETSS